MVKKVYSLDEYDKYLCLKPSRGLWLVVFFLLSLFVIMLLTFLLGRGGGDTTFLKDIQKELYPDNLSLMLAFLSSIPTLIFMYAWIRRKPGASGYIKKICLHGAVMLNATAIMNVVIVFVPLLTTGIRGIHWIGWGQAGLLLIVISYLNSSQRVKDTFSDFPK